MKKIFLSLFILSFIHFVFIGLGGLQSINNNSYEQSKTVSFSELYNNDQVYDVAKERNSNFHFFTSEITNEDINNLTKVDLSSPVAFESTNTHILKNLSEHFNISIPVKTDRYLLLQNFRL